MKQILIAVVLGVMTGGIHAENACDIDNSAGPTAGDVLLLERHLTGSIDLDPAQVSSCDLNVDGVLSSADLLLLQQGVFVPADQFELLHSPTEGSDIPLSPAAENITLTWSIAGVPQAGNPIGFVATRGVLNVPNAVTDALGKATVSITSQTAGPTTLFASAAGGESATLILEFVSTNPSQISVQADPYTVMTGGTSDITAIVRDPLFNLVKNQRVDFVVEADDSGGSLSAAFAITDSTGRAMTVFTAGPNPAGINSVEISATVDGTALTGTVFLTVVAP